VGVSNNWLLRAPMRTGTRVTGIAAAACAACRLAMWSVAAPLHDVQRQLRNGIAPVGGWTLDRVTVAAAAVGIVVGGVAVLVLLALNVASTCLASALPTLDVVAAEVTPTSLRRAAMALCGLALTATGTTAVASSDGCGSPPCPAEHPRPVVTGLPLPDLPTTKAASTVTVQPGDSLWSIARSELLPNARAAAVATRASRLYADNRRTIGTDPDLIFPGQQLHAPGGVS
jgi:nucleoid-associated protein YgaU